MDRQAQRDQARDALVALFEGFGSRRLISMKARVERRQRIDASLARYGLSLAKLGVEIFDGLSFDDANGFPSKGVRGCFTSHMTLMQECAASGKPMLVLEDDIDFNFDRIAAFRQAVPDLQQEDWGLVYLGYIVPETSGPARLETFGGGTIGGHFYGVTPALARAVGDYMQSCTTRPPGDPEGGPMYRDGAFTMFRQRHPELTTKLAIPSLGGQFSSRSDLTPKAYQRWPLVGPILDKMYEAKAWLRR
jgi:glycosyl transferase, family 25